MPYKKWTKAEEAFLEARYREGVPVKEIAEQLGRTKESVYRRHHELVHDGAPSARVTELVSETQAQTKELASKNRSPWTVSDFEILMSMYREGVEQKYIALELGRTFRAIQGKITLLLKDGTIERRRKQ